MQPSVSPANVTNETTSTTTSLTEARARVDMTVTDADTAQALGSGDVPVLGTPRVLALVEAATVAATARRIPAGMTTVGTHVTLDHRAATPLGHTVTAEAHLVENEGKKLRFTVSVRDGSTLVAEGVVERIIVDRQRFLAKVIGSA